MIRLVRRRSDVSKEDFSRWWREDHSRLFRETEAVSRHVVSYVQHHVDWIRDPSGLFEFDGLGEVVFRDKAAFDAFAAEPLTPMLREDEARFIDLDKVVVTFVTDAPILPEPAPQEA